MTPSRWFEHPRALAALTLAFALVPAGFAWVTFRTARERDAKLFHTAADVLAEQLKLRSLQHINFLNVLRNQHRYADDLSSEAAAPQPPAGWAARLPHLRGYSFASHDGGAAIPIRWQQGRGLPFDKGVNLAEHPALASALVQARQSGIPAAVSAAIEPGLIAIVEAVNGPEMRSPVRGYIIGWLDAAAICGDGSLPLLKLQALQARPAAADEAGSREDRKAEIGESEAGWKWHAMIRRGPAFSREYGTPTPWLGFAALALSALPLSALVIIASRAGKLRAALDAERELGQMRSHFVNSVSHEFRTPLSIILSAAELLEAHGGNLSDERRTAIISQIRGSTGQMTTMVDQVLMLGRMESEKAAARPQQTNLRELCEAIIRELPARDAARVALQIDAQPPAAMLDPALLRGMLGNLLSNAVKFSPDGKPVRLTVARRGEHLDFTVQDEGIGISAADLPHVCEPFHRGANASEIPGTGLGLAIARKCAELHGGTLKIESEPGKGTRILIILPQNALPPP